MELDTRRCYSSVDGRQNCRNELGLDENVPMF